MFFFSLSPRNSTNLLSILKGPYEVTNIATVTAAPFSNAMSVFIVYTAYK
jgi:hypothetical protein